MININDVLKVKIIDEDNKGNGIAKINNLVIFIKNALLNEELEIKITNKEKKYLEGIPLRFIKKSKRRIESICPVYNNCGGCNFLHISYEEETIKKKELISSVFPNIKIIFVENKEYLFYRNNINLHCSNKKLGFYKKKTNEIIEFDKCYITNESINSLVSYLKKVNFNNSELIIRGTDDNLMLYIKGKIKKSDIEYILDSSLVKSLYINEFSYNLKNITLCIDKYKFNILPNTFFQINKYNTINLYNVIKDYAGVGKSLLDLYCGVGGVGIYLSENFKKVTGVEINKSSIKSALENKLINNIKNINFIAGDSSIVKDGVYDVLIVDPPRSGLTKNVINNIINIYPKRIVYVSCNYKTLKRDIELMKDNYKLIEITLVDMFSRTEHIETICLLESI